MLPSRRTRGRAVLACVLVGGLVIALFATSHIGYSDDRGDAEAGRRGTLPVEATPAPAVPEVHAMPAMPVAPAVSYPVATAAFAKPGTTQAAPVAHTRRPAATMAAPVDPPRSPLPEAKRVAAPPRLRPDAPAARSPAPPIEDLYDTR